MIFLGYLVGAGVFGEQNGGTVGDAETVGAADGDAVSFTFFNRRRPVPSPSKHRTKWGKRRGSRTKSKEIFILKYFSISAFARIL